VRLDPAQLLVDAAAAVRRGHLSDAREIATAVVDLELAGEPDVHRLQVAMRLTRQIGELNGTLAAAEVGGDVGRGAQLVIPWVR
jgi:hypothetical protein